MDLIFQPPIIAHRGASGYAPENTMAAFNKAAQLGIRWVEFDVMLSTEGEPIIFHDETLDRTTNARGDIVHHPYSYLKTLDAGSWFHQHFAGEHIPTLKEVLAFLMQHQMCANVEIKPLPGQEESTAIAAVEIIETFFPQPHPAILFSSFSVKSLQALRQQSSNCLMGLLLEEWTPGWEGTVNDLQCVSVHVDHVLLNPDTCNKIKDLNKSLLCYTVNDPARAAQLYGWGVDAVFSDVPDRILHSILV